MGEVAFILDSTGCVSTTTKTVWDEKHNPRRFSMLTAHCVFFIPTNVLSLGHAPERTCGVSFARALRVVSCGAGSIGLRVRAGSASLIEWEPSLTSLAVALRRVAGFGS